MKILIINDIEVKIGSNQLENQLLIDEMDPDHSWFHIEDVPSAHLVIPISYLKLDSKTLYLIALELKKNSKYKKMNFITVIYTHRKSLKLTTTPGKVFVTGKINTIKV